jgi:hypothetical protein
MTKIYTISIWSGITKDKKCPYFTVQITFNEDKVKVVKTYYCFFNNKNYSTFFNKEYISITIVEEGLQFTFKSNRLQLEDLITAYESNNPKAPKFKKIYPENEITYEDDKINEQIDKLNKLLGK